MTDVPPPIKARTESDVMSGMEVHRSYERYPHFSTEELDNYFQQFKNFDVDDSGFISPANLSEVLAAMDIAMTVEQTRCMIEEVAVLSGHDNDGKLSFRDYMACIQYDTNAEAHNNKIEADIELRLSLSEDTLPLSISDTTADNETATAEESSPPSRMRRSSFSVMQAIAKSRISSYEQTSALSPTSITHHEIQIQACEAKKPTDPKDNVPSKFISRLDKFKRIEAQACEAKKPTDPKDNVPSKFISRLDKFKRIEAKNAAGGTAPSVNNECLQAAALKTKLLAFEQASKKVDPVLFKKSWKNVSHGSWALKSKVVGGVAPKKTLAQVMEERG
eukprot:CAMPEP_0119343406 /NCGR_PEP_ID=MMETSP1333-20130426/106430_1 /TAXON_ID=418940 /ORGANISM="Scyphosphaera apsteinii, Strain RCC1455" /LENGTH=332 /DNA_ID=CAMNT_0007355795 /DNA_START=25 /DNA_END=1023 /DNA_ORIENTATION=+